MSSNVCQLVDTMYDLIESKSMHNDDLSKSEMLFMSKLLDQILLALNAE